MKKALKSTILLLVISMLNIPLFAQTFPEAIGIRKIKLKESTNAVEFQNSVKKDGRAIANYSNGAYLGLLIGDRGERKGEYLHGWAFDLVENRDYYFPGADSDSYEKLNKLAEVANVSANPNDPRVESGMDKYTDYVMVGYDAIPYPHGGELISLREIEVKAGQEEAFEKFLLEEFYPNVYEAIEGLSVYIMKGDRGERKGKYLHVYCFDTIGRRNTYFPEEDGDASEALQKQVEKLSDLNNKFGSFMNPDVQVGYTDYLMVR